jgi:hypothetical protein
MIDVIVCSIVNYTALTGYASQTFTHPNLNPSISDTPYPSQSQYLAPTLSPTSPTHTNPQWFSDFRRIISSTNVTSHEITSLLALLSSSIQTGQPLPPYLTAPQGYQLSKQLEAVDHDILSLRHIAEPGYAAFAVMAISTRCIHMDLERLLKAVRDLVGELDFSFHVVSTKGGEGSEETLVKNESRRKKD